MVAQRANSLAIEIDARSLIAELGKKNTTPDEGWFVSVKVRQWFGLA